MHEVFKLFLLEFKTKFNMLSKAFFKCKSLKLRNPGPRTFAVATVSGVVICSSSIKKENPMIPRSHMMALPNENKMESIVLSRNFVADAVECVSPAVVNIIGSINGVVSSSSISGSGFIISKDGFIVTNAHVVAQFKNGKVGVVLKNGRKMIASVHSIDAKSDIALIKLDDISYDLPTVKFGSSSKLRAGDFVIAIGSPMQLQNSVSFGIVSATARHASELGLSNNRSEYIQTDAAINVGNSGGPLVNLDGEVVGINTMKVKGTDGISLAIPMDTATQIIDQLVKYGKVTRSFVGLKLSNEPLNQQVANSSKRISKKKTDLAMMTNDTETRAVVQEVIKGSPAFYSGLQSKDIILEVNGKDTRGTRDVLKVIGLEVGKSIEFKVRRENVGELNFTLITAPEL